MSVADLQKRLADLHLSLEETIKALKTEQEASEADYEAWEEEGNSLEGAELEDHNNESPDVIDNNEKINAVELAGDRVNEAIAALDAALED